MVEETGEHILGAQLPPRAPERGTGGRGLGPIERFRLGSVSTKVLRAALEPVLVNPHPLLQGAVG
jgi:hypothetical protein